MIKFKKSGHLVHSRLGSVHVGLPMLEVLETLPRVAANVAHEAVEFISLQPQTDADTPAGDAYCQLDIHPVFQFRGLPFPQQIGNYDFLDREKLGETTMAFANDLRRFGLPEDSPITRADILVRDSQVYHPNRPEPLLLREVFITFHWG